MLYWEVAILFLMLFLLKLLLLLSLSLLSRLPELSVLFFCRNFDDSRFVDDASCTVTFLNDADDPGLITLLLLDVLLNK